MNPIKFLKKTLIVELGFAAAPFVGGVAATSAAASGYAGIAAASGGGLFGGSLLSNLSTAFSVGSRIYGGIQESKQLKAQANVEKFNARTREIGRKRNLVRSLALQNVRAGAGGIAPDGSVAAIQQEDLSRFELDQAIDTAGTGQRVSQLQQNAGYATNFSLLSAAGEGFGAYRRTQQRGTA